MHPNPENTVTAHRVFVLFAAPCLVIIGVGLILLGYDAFTSSPILNEDTRLAGMMLEVIGVACIGAAVWGIKINFFTKIALGSPDPHAH